MKAFVAQVDHGGLRRLVSEDLIPGDELRRMVHRRSPGSSSVVWALLQESDAEALRAEVAAGRHHDACGLLLNWAIELLSISAGMPGPVHTV